MSDKRRKLMDVAGEWRYDFKAQIGRCEVCLKQREPEQLACHEIARGNGMRQKFLMAPYGILVVCAEPSYRTGRDCHQSIQCWCQPKQLALLYLVDQSRYDLTKFNETVNPRAPNRITQEDVDQYIRQVFDTFKA